MIVTFVSQCEKNALKKTRRVLDAFANRIGERTWQTVITMDGLKAVRKLLRKGASKNTAVACHRIRSRNLTELEWIVGNRQKFNSQGIVPVNSTQRNILNSQWENDWHYLPLIKALAALAALFHDWGKASVWFQDKLRKSSNKPVGDPLRHEWISSLLICAFVQDTENDEEWLSRLENGDIDEAKLQDILQTWMKGNRDGKGTGHFANLPDFASAIVWLVLSHHRMPLPMDFKKWKGESAESIQAILRRIAPRWGYENRFDENRYQANLMQCFEFSEGFPCQSVRWLKQIRRWAGKAKGLLALMDKSMADGTIRVVLCHARLCLMVGDHYYSSQDADPTWSDETKLFANTGGNPPELKQKLDEHLVGVARNALNTAHLLPAFEIEPPVAYDVKFLKKKSPQPFKWQDKAVDKIKGWRERLPEATQGSHHGFFCINMASTGCGKTTGNAKVMRALSRDGESLRYVLALGLRTLTLQTGDEYRKRIGLDNSELAVMIGSRAVKELHHLNREKERAAAYHEHAGSESLESFIDEEIDYDCDIPEKGLATVLRDERDRKFLYAPVLACTIDHLMGATETRRGGRYILPELRLMFSDLVIDEVDDFTGKDLVAIGRLVHLAGMLGRKVMLSSATIPPALAEGYFNAYREGWQLFSRTRDVAAGIGCAWIDEFNTQVETIAEPASSKAQTAFSECHSQFVGRRVQKLKKQPEKRKGEIIDCQQLYDEFKNRSVYDAQTLHSLERAYFEIQKQVIIKKHLQHNTTDRKTGIRVSFGVVRMANIGPCIELSEFLMGAEWPAGVEPKVMAYHSRQVLLLRHEQERHLDEVLERKEGDGEEPAAFKNRVIRKHLDTTHADHVLFILVATPVEEVGRDHDFDWAVPEPSSYRSIVQLAGRVLRHRHHVPECANIALMQYNLNAIKYGLDRPAYCKPGYEDGDDLKLATHDLKILVDEKSIAHSVNAIPRITCHEPLLKEERLADLEHYATATLLKDCSQVGPESMQGWLTQYWWMTAIPQSASPFRESNPTRNIFRIYDQGGLVFKEKDDKGELVPVEQIYGIEYDAEVRGSDRLWLERDYVSLLEKWADMTDGLSLKVISVKYGEMNIPDPGTSVKRYLYSDRYGLKRVIE